MQKYSDKFLNNSNILTKSIIGLEFEFFMSSLSYYKTLEILNQILSPIQVYGFKQYHPDFKPTETKWLITPDLSGGNSMCELITGPLSYLECKIYLVKILKFIQEYGYTTEKCAIHFNISFDAEKCDKDLNDLNILKLILNTDEDDIYKYFPNRKGNIYAKSVRKIIPYKDYDYNSIPIEVVKNSLRFPDDKYYGINFLHMNKSREEQRLEYRYIGGKDYEKNYGDIITFMDKFILNSYNCIDVGFDDSDVQKLEDYLEENISIYKNFSKYDNFIVEFPSISLQIDQNNDYDIVNANYTRIYNKLFNLIDATDDLKDCIINYVTETKTVEIIDANIKTNFNVKNYDFINCTLSDGVFDKVMIVNCEVKNCQISNSRIEGSDVLSSKILNCHSENSQIVNSFFMGGYLNCVINGGVIRSGEIGPYANISSETKIISDTDNFFNTSFDDDNYDFKSDKGAIKNFKK